MLKYILGAAAVVSAKNVDFANVQADIQALLPNPAADSGNYGPLFIRLAWHCAGTYRTTDGRGGCDGARIRISPESDSPDNAGLAAALELLRPIKDSYPAMSWGDLIVLAGTTAITTNNGPEVKFCAGRVDVDEGSDSPIYMEDGTDSPNGLIYVDAGAAGPKEIRDQFTLMDMNDQETVALVGGGHAFGKCHSTSSGFEGPWTRDPTNWSNEYFGNLLTIEWEATKSPKGQPQFNSPDGALMMLTADIALTKDESYLQLAQMYAQDEDALTRDFGAAWYKLMTRDQGAKPCLGEEEPAFVPVLNYAKVRKSIVGIFANEDADFGHYGPLLVRLAWHCSGTYRSTDHRGGCNGARIRHEPEFSWGENMNLDKALDLLEPIKSEFGVELTWSDLIVLTGTTALEEMGANPMTFCPGRTDDEDGSASQYLDEAIYINGETGTAAQIKESMRIMGFSAREMTVLNGGGHSVGQTHTGTSGFTGPWTHSPTEVSNSFFTLLLENDWTAKMSEGDRKQFTDSSTGTLTMLHTDLEFKKDPEFRTFVDIYAGDDALFQAEFAAAWTKLMNANYWRCEPSMAHHECSSDADCGVGGTCSCSNHRLRRLLFGGNSEAECMCL